MITQPHNMTPEQLASRLYERVPYKPGKCAGSVRESGRWPRYPQCSRDSGHGAGGLYCKQHAKTYPDLSGADRVVRYEIMPYSDTIIPHDVSESLGHYYTAAGRRFKKEDLFRSWDDAHAWIVSRRQHELDLARKSVSAAESRLAAALSIQKPAEEVKR